MFDDSKCLSSQAQTTIYIRTCQASYIVQNKPKIESSIGVKYGKIIKTGMFYVCVFYVDAFKNMMVLSYKLITLNVIGMYPVLCHAARLCIALHCTALTCTELHCITLHFIVL